MKHTSMMIEKMEYEGLSSYSDEHIKMAFEYFADQIDKRIQENLVSELMSRYAQISTRLEKSDARLREAQEIALLGNWEIDVQTKELTWSDTVSRILELEEGVQSSLDLYFSKVYPEDYGKAKRPMEDFWKGAGGLELRYRLLMESGRIKWVHVRSIVMRDFSGNPISVHGTIQDITEVKAAEEKMKEYNNHLQDLVQEKVEEVSSAQIATIHALVKLAESRDDDTGGHIGRTSEYCKLIAKKLWEMGEYPDEIGSNFIENIAKAAPLHDIGKVGISDAILLKPGRLTPEEFEIMKTHVTIGYETLASIEKRYNANEFIRIGMEITLGHHEKWDGSGYPNRLKGDDIPISARIMALSDVYDALRSKRVYKEAFSHEKSKSIIEEGRGTHFDPLLVDIFLENHKGFADIYKRTTDT